MTIDTKCSGKVVFQHGEEQLYTEKELARLVKQGKAKRWVVTVLLKDGEGNEYLQSCKWATSYKAAIREAKEWLRENTEYQEGEVTGWLSNMLEETKEITL